MLLGSAEMSNSPARSLHLDVTMERPPSRLRLGLAWVQGLFDLATGIWPLVHMRSFLWVTGPKVDLWLVRTVGILIALIGVVLLMAARRRRIGPELIVLAMGAAAGLAGIDLYYALTGRISDVYLLDAVAEIALAVLWGAAALRGRNWYR